MPANPLALTVYPHHKEAVTDTASSRVPVYFIHSFEQPFCQDEGSSCHRHKQAVVRLFVKTIEGHFELEQASRLLKDEKVEEK